MAILTFITPVAPYHLDKVERVRAQVSAQSVPCEHVVVLDTDQRGPSWARNHGVAQASTPLVSFLDADDELDPTYAAKMIKYWKPGHYLYCDHIAGDRPVHLGLGQLMTPPVFRHHVVTCVLSKQIFNYVGGFDETMTSLEDTEFWFRCLNLGVCPIYIPELLMRYNAGGLNSKRAQRDPSALARWNDLIKNHRFNMCKCNEKVPADPVPLNHEFEGSVLVVANWGGAREWAGKATGRRYPRSGNGKQLWVDQRDQARQPHRLILVNFDAMNADIQELPK